MISDDITGGLRPGFTRCTCVTATCGTCHEPFGEDGDLHFATVDAAATALTDVGWWVTQDGVQCPQCAGAQACAEFGHVWGEWWSCGCGCATFSPTRIATHLWPMQTRSCESCGEIDYQAREVP